MVHVLGCQATMTLLLDEQSEPRQQLSSVFLWQLHSYGLALVRSNTLGIYVLGPFGRERPVVLDMIPSPHRFCQHCQPLQASTKSRKRIQPGAPPMVTSATAKGTFWLGHVLAGCFQAVRTI